MRQSIKQIVSNANVAGAALALAMAGIFAATGTADAQKKKKEFEKLVCDKVEVISHASPGGGTDTTARMMMIRARRYLQKAGYTKDMIVVYKRGGQARKAHEYFNRRPTDGCTIMAITQSHMNTLETKSPITIDDMVGVARAMDDPTFITVNAKSSYKTLKDLINASKKKALNWGVAQVGGTEH